MTPYYIWIASAALVWCAGIFSLRLLGLLRKGAPKDLSRPSGSAAKGVVYSCTTAMLPQHKESAYLHLPTYAAGIAFHVGIALNLLVFFWLLLSHFMGWYWMPPAFWSGALAGFLLVAGVCGAGMLGKRIFNKGLRALSLPDDYISNGLVTLFLLASSVLFWGKMPVALYFILSALLLFWLPIGKTRHLLYFFAARFHLGFFYGRRGAWPVNK